MVIYGLTSVDLDGVDCDRITHGDNLANLMLKNLPLAQVKLAVILLFVWIIRANLLIRMELDVNLMILLFIVIRSSFVLKVILL